MKTRELLTCDVRTFGTRIQGLKPKELRRQIDAFSSILGEADSDGLMEAVVDAVFDGSDLPDTTRDEMQRVITALERRIGPGPDQEETLWRLTALCVTFLRKEVKAAALAQRMARRMEDHHHACGDPNCADHHHAHDHQHGVEATAPDVEQKPLASVTRSAID